MKRWLALLGLWGALGASVPQEKIRIPVFGPYCAKKYEEGIRKRDPIALMELNLETRFGCVRFDEQSQAMILKKVKALAEAGDGYAMYLMADVVPDRNRGPIHPWYKRSAEAGDPYGQISFWGEIKRNKNSYEPYRNLNAEPYFRKAFEAFKKRAEKGDRRAMFQMRFGFYNQLTKAERDALEEKLFQGKDWIAYDAMYSKAKNELSRDYEFEREEFFKLMNAAAEGGNIHAMQYLADYYYAGKDYYFKGNKYLKPPPKPDIQKAWSWLRRRWLAIGCEGEPYTEDAQGKPWRKVGESDKAYRKRTEEKVEPNPPPVPELH